MRNLGYWASVALGMLAMACTGLTQGERDPGGDTYLEAGAIAVDDRTETVFVLQTYCDEPAEPTCPGIETKTVHVIDAEASTPRTGLDATGLRDLRILFPAGAVMLMGERSAAQEELRLLDPTTLEERVRTTVNARYHGTRMSPSRRWVAVGDNSVTGIPIHIIDTSTTALTTHVLPHDGSWAEAMWLNQSDELMAIVFNSTIETARILSWSMQELVEKDFALDAEGTYWADPTRDIEVPDTQRDLVFSYTWVGIAPDNSYAVFPVRQDSVHVLLVLNLATGELRTVHDARGPVGFSPDSSTIVSYRYVDEGAGLRPQLLLVRTDTLDETALPIPFAQGPQFFVTREGHFVVVAASLGNEQLVLYDLDEGTMTELDGPAVGLHEFVSRVGHGELWLVQNGLFRLDFYAPELEAIALDWTPAHINIQRTRDLLVMDDVDAPRLMFWSPEERAVTREVLLPDPTL
jgi:hypothetical protein